MHQIQSLFGESNRFAVNPIIMLWIKSRDRGGGGGVGMEILIFLDITLFCFNSKNCNPPVAVKYSSCFPIGQFKILRSILKAVSAILVEFNFLLFIKFNVLIKLTANELDAPNPEPAGTSLHKIASKPFL